MKDGVMDKDQEELLRILETHGQQFIGSFDTRVVKGKRKESSGLVASKQKRRRLEEHSNSEEDEEDAEEWHGFSDASGSHSDREADDDGAQNGSRNGLPRKPDLVVFSEQDISSSTSTSQPSKAQMKAFMSSKVEKVRKEVSDDRGGNNSEEDEEGDLTNLQNDALLHRLVHTKILSGSLNNDLDLTPAQRRKALAGRVLEAAGKVKLGKGEKAVRSSERNRAAKHVRDGLLSKQKERNEKMLEEAKHMGNYHPALKNVFDDSSSKAGPKRRERGMRMGVGSFSGGVLKLSRGEIATATGAQRGRGRGRGGSRGRGRGGRGSQRGGRR
ncbi:unnamed protein product [Somion occarium]|uniref:RRP15-like protein n=1 Tax=Somion occarium TaxID=3059160 RepID=A0ABP1D2Q4_9APHY